jgi:phosphoribosylformimino-5-aminoimidazole carboxamide ribotide isomerase
MEDIEEVLASGVHRAIIGTAAVKNPDLVTEAVEKYGCSHVVVGIDARDGEVRVQGWTEGSGIDAVEMALDMEKRGIRRIIYTDISKDGTLEGPSIDAYRTMGEKLTRARITASGGIGGYLDLLRIKELAPYRVDSVIVGRALYDNRFPCQQFWCWHNKDELDLNRYSTVLDRGLASDAC